MNPLSKLLSEELNRRQSRNKNYSMRAFAHTLSLEPSAFSKILKGHRIPTLLTLNKILEALQLPSEMTTPVLNWHKKIHSEKNELVKFVNESPTNAESKLQIEIHHLVILEALRISAFSESIEDLRHLMEIPSEEFYKSLVELDHAGLLKYDPSAKQVAILNTQNTTLSIAITSAKLRKVQRQFLAMAAKAVEEVSPDHRDNTTLTVAIPVSKIPYFKKLIQKTRRRINSIAEMEIEGADSVYNFTFAIYPAIKLKTP
jgi:uncharacterized protein (TIGR02147 family)